MQTDSENLNPRTGRHPGDLLKTGQSADVYLTKTFEHPEVVFKRYTPGDSMSL